jgi:hypothetical protein
MDRIRQIWVEAASPSTIHQKENHQATTNSPILSISRPPPLRTSSTYDDDEVFHNVSVNMLSRYESLGLSAQEAILATLVSPKQRASFFEGLCVRIDRVAHCSPITASLIKSMNRVFGRALKELIDADEENSNPTSTLNHHPFIYGTSKNKPTTPRAMGGEGGLSHPPSTSSSSSSARGTDKKSRRCFFPDSKGRNTIGFFRKRRVQNIDWKLLQSVQRVENLRLDDDDSNTARGGVPIAGVTGTNSLVPLFTSITSNSNGMRNGNQNHQTNSSSTTTSTMNPRGTASSSYEAPTFGGF